MLTRRIQSIFSENLSEALDSAYDAEAIVVCLVQYSTLSLTVLSEKKLNARDIPFICIASSDVYSLMESLISTGLRLCTSTGELILDEEAKQDYLWRCLTVEGDVFVLLPGTIPEDMSCLRPIANISVANVTSLSTLVDDAIAGISRCADL